MKIQLFGRSTEELKKLVVSLGFEIVYKNPDVIISYGGDGTLLSCEREFPEIPKLPLRQTKYCNKCSNHTDKIILEKLKTAQLKYKTHKKLTTNIYGKDLFALNDFILRNEELVHTIRFKINNSDLIIGDGIVISTPFGSTGYFKSISGKTFTDGFAVAFNNPTVKSNSIYVDQDEIDKLDDFTYIEFELKRGKAILGFDNSDETYKISEGTKLAFKLSNQIAGIYSDTSLRCPDCKVIRG